MRVGKSYVRMVCNVAINICITYYIHNIHKVCMYVFLITMSNLMVFELPPIYPFSHTLQVQTPLPISIGWTKIDYISFATYIWSVDYVYKK